MIRNAILPDNYTYHFLFKECASFYGIKERKEIHGRLLKSGTEPNLVTLNSLMHLYVISGFINESHKVFEKLPERNVVVWSNLINEYAHSGRSQEAMVMFV